MKPSHGRVPWRSPAPLPPDKASGKTKEAVVTVVVIGLIVFCVVIVSGPRNEPAASIEMRPDKAIVIEDPTFREQQNEGDAGSDFTHYAWRAKFTNQGPTPRAFSPWVSLFDAQGFEVESAAGRQQTLEPGETRTISEETICDARKFSHAHTINVSAR
jgi:hypothetical protein